MADGNAESIRSPPDVTTLHLRHHDGLHLAIACSFAADEGLHLAIACSFAADEGLHRRQCTSW